MYNETTPVNITGSSQQIVLRLIEHARKCPGIWSPVPFRFDGDHGLYIVMRYSNGMLFLNDDGLSARISDYDAAKKICDKYGISLTLYGGEFSAYCCMELVITKKSHKRLLEFTNVMKDVRSLREKNDTETKTEEPEKNYEAHSADPSSIGDIWFAGRCDKSKMFGLRPSKEETPKEPNSKTSDTNVYFYETICNTCDDICTIWENLNKITCEELTEITKDVKELWLKAIEFNDKWEHLKERM